MRGICARGKWTWNCRGQYRSNYTASTHSGASKCSRCANTAKVLRCYSVAVVSAKTAKVLRFSYAAAVSESRRNSVLFVLPVLCLPFNVFSPHFFHIYLSLGLLFSSSVHYQQMQNLNIRPPQARRRKADVAEADVPQSQLCA